MRLPLRTLPVPIAAVSLSPSCSCLMAPMALALILGWCLVAASRAQHQPPPSLSLHPSQGVSVGDTVTLRCHLPQQAAWVQLWFNGTLRSDKEKDKEQDTVEFSLVVTNLEDAGTYQCRYQVSEPLWTSNMSDPMELVVTGAKGPSHGNLVVAVVRGCVAVFVFCLGLYFVLDARSLWTQRDESPGVPPGMTEAVQIQVPSSDSEDLTYAEMQDATPCSQPSTSHTALQSPVIYTKVSTGLPC
ncbi:T-cell-interacting, activating receptor on myeloid cells protein 1-like isoform X2 [Numida meleagris]|uniref:T-cell-interacting, activating receptor on myeloid cells protein 1-like isoform X2 n=1 Tax=Numida meleagris TaxID=8996 RepID=UPI000B3DBA81|nr:T-cell-interacting, activating receptor on myeloid cells protein 1-like isoform X2 [Numida meleagris]